MENKFREYLEDNDKEIRIEINEEDFNLAKKDLSKLARIYLSYYDEFFRLFKNFHDAEETFKENEKLVSEIRKKIAIYDISSINFGRSDLKKEIINFVLDNYSKISQFINLCVEVFEE